MDKKRKKDDTPCRNSLERITLDDLMNVVSGNECTGLMPTPPIDFEEAESYNDIYDVPAVESRVNTHPHRND